MILAKVAELICTAGPYFLLPDSVVVVDWQGREMIQ